MLLVHIFGSITHPELALKRLLEPMAPNTGTTYEPSD